MPAKKDGFQLVPSDIALLRYVHELGRATIEHAATLANRSYKQAAERLAKLEKRGYLACVARRPNKHLYAVGPDGIEALVMNGYAPPELAAKRLRHGELQQLGIRHAIFVSSIHVKLLQLVAPRALTLARWVEGPSLFDTVTTSDKKTIPIRPDASFTIAWSDGGKVHFFLEADRGTMAHSRMREKITGYAAYFHQQRHVKKHPGMKMFRVATITETRGRADALTSEFRTMMPAAWLAAYPVIAFEDLTLEALMPELVETPRA